MKHEETHVSMVVFGLNCVDTFGIKLIIKLV